MPDDSVPTTDYSLEARVGRLRARLLALPAIYVSNALYPPDLEWAEAFKVNDDGSVAVFHGIDSLSAVVTEVESLHRRLGTSG